jgi:hypothetical protein
MDLVIKENLMKDMICGYHTKIMLRCEEIKDAWKNGLTSDDIYPMIDDIYEAAKEALKAGESMENRLRTRTTIESLGFMRVKHE